MMVGGACSKSTPTRGGQIDFLDDEWGGMVVLILALKNIASC